MLRPLLDAFTTELHMADTLSFTLLFPITCGIAMERLLAMTGLSV